MEFIIKMYRKNPFLLTSFPKIKKKIPTMATLKYSLCSKNNFKDFTHILPGNL